MFQVAFALPDAGMNLADDRRLRNKADDGRRLGVTAWR